MLKILKTFKPTLFALFIFVILILSQLLFTDGTAGGTFGGEVSTWESHDEYGVIPVIIIDKKHTEKYPVLKGDVRATMSREEYEKLAEIEDTKNVEIKWGLLVLNLGLCYILATLLSKVNKFIKINRIALVYLITALGICLIAFIVSIIISKNEWGYYLSRPKVISNVKDISQVKAVIPIRTENDTSGNRHIIIGTDYSIPENLSGYSDSYYCLEQRLLIYLNDKDLLPDSLTLDLADLTGLHSLIVQTGILIKPDEGYDASDLLSGIVVDALNEKGERIVLMGVRGMELSNDHFPYYELAFEGKHSENLKFVSGQHFFYDIAGIEGFEWYVFFLCFSFCAVPIGMIVLTVILILWKIIRKIHRWYLQNSITPPI